MVEEGVWKFKSVWWRSMCKSLKVSGGRGVGMVLKQDQQHNLQLWVVSKMRYEELGLVTGVVFCVSCFTGWGLDMLWLGFTVCLLVRLCSANTGCGYML